MCVASTRFSAAPPLSLNSSVLLSCCRPHLLCLLLSTVLSVRHHTPFGEVCSNLPHDFQCIGSAQLHAPYLGENGKGKGKNDEGTRKEKPDIYISIYIFFLRRYCTPCSVSCLVSPFQPSSCCHIRGTCGSPPWCSRVRKPRSLPSRPMPRRVRCETHGRGKRRARHKSDVQATTK